jgi:hypothetical protein
MIEMSVRTLKNKTMIPLLLVASALWLAPGQLFAQNPHIDVAVRESGGVAEIVFLNSACPNGQRGCVQMPRGESNWISWEFDQDTSQAGWSFEGLYFGAADKQVGNLKDCTVDAFGLSEADRASGDASTAEIFANGKRLRIWDENDRECITHYTLRAVNDDTGQTAESDPVIDNRGRR